MNIPTDKKNKSVEQMFEIMSEPNSESNPFRQFNEWKRRIERCYDIAFKDGFRQRDAEIITGGIKDND